MYVNYLHISFLQLEVFGHRLQPTEFERMDAQRQKTACDQMMMLIQKWRDDRRARELRQLK